MVCESCNTRVDPDRFCTNCGAPLLISDAPVAEPVNVGRIILYGLLGVLTSTVVDSVDGGLASDAEVGSV